MFITICFSSNEKKVWIENLMFPFLSSILCFYEMQNKRLIPKSHFISFLKKRWIIDKLEKTMCLEKNDGNKYKQTADGKLHCHQNICKIKNNLHEVCLGKLIKLVFQFLNVLYIVEIKSVLLTWFKFYFTDWR